MLQSNTKAHLKSPRTERRWKGLEGLCCSGILKETTNWTKHNTCKWANTHCAHTHRRAHTHVRDPTVWPLHGGGGLYCKSYRAVEHALAIHGNVEATLHSLDGHHSQTHRNKIKQGCRADRVRAGVGWREGQTDGSKRGRDKRETSDRKDRIGQLSFHLTLVDTTACDLCSLAICQQ